MVRGAFALLGTLAGTLMISSAALAQLNPSPNIFCEPQFRDRFSERCGVTPDANAIEPAPEMMPEEAEAAMPDADMVPETEATVPDTNDLMPDTEAATPDLDMMEESTSEMPAMPADESADMMESMEEPTAESMEDMPAEMTASGDTIVDVAAANDSFETLVAAVEAAGLSETLSGEGPYTVFAPTDEAFEALPEGVLEQLLLPENKDLLAAILTYHVVPGKVTSGEITPGEVNTVEGSPILLSVTDGMVGVNNATVVMADVEASNGVIHAIDQIILPPTLTSMVSEDVNQ